MRCRIFCCSAALIPLWTNTSPRLGTFLRGQAQAQILAGQKDVIHKDTQEEPGPAPLPHCKPNLLTPLRDSSARFQTPPRAHAACTLRGETADAPKDHRRHRLRHCSGREHVGRRCTPARSRRWSAWEVCPSAGSSRPDKLSGSAGRPSGNAQGL
eukprot:gene13251-biopygen6497